MQNFELQEHISCTRQDHHLSSPDLQLVTHDSFKTPLIMYLRDVFILVSYIPIFIFKLEIISFLTFAILHILFQISF